MDDDIAESRTTNRPQTWNENENEAQLTELARTVGLVFAERASTSENFSPADLLVKYYRMGER